MISRGGQSAPSGVRRPLRPDPDVLAPRSDRQRSRAPRPDLSLGAAVPDLIPPPPEDIASPVTHNGVTIDRDWRITGITVEAAEWLGLTVSEALGADCRNRMFLPQSVMSAIGSSFVTSRASTVVGPSIRYPGRWIECQIHPISSGVSVLFWDVTERRFPRALPGGDPNHGQAISNTPRVEIALLDENAVIVSVNEAWLTANAPLQRPGSPIGVGTPYVDACRLLMPSQDAEALAQELRDVIDGAASSLVRYYEVGVGDGARWRQVQITRLLLGGAIQLVAMHEDLIEISNSSEALSRTTERLLSAQEEERQRIAIELHDSTSQHLAALGFGVARLRRMTGKSEGAVEVLADMSKSLHEAVKEIRVLSYLMSPPNLLRDGLERTAERFVRGFGLRTGLEVTYFAGGPIDEASTMAQHAIFRVIQESLSNVHHHADAGAVEVDLLNRGHALTLRVSDNGRGFARAGGIEAVQPGVGIAGMHSRMEQLGGVLEISCSPAGTVVYATLPLVSGGMTPVSAA